MRLSFKQKRLFSTKEKCLKQIKEDGTLIRFVPVHLLTNEMCEIAVKEDGFNLQFIPDQFKDLKICELAREFDEWAVLFYPSEKFQIEDLDYLFV